MYTVSLGYTIVLSRYHDSVIVKGVPDAKRTERRETALDTVGAAIMVAKIATVEVEEKLPGPGKRKAGMVGGPKRAQSLTQEGRSEIAREGALSRGRLPIPSRAAQ